jgi:hypothetical protein
MSEPNLIFGLDDDWNCTDIGDAMLYSCSPDNIPDEFVPRVIYELRCDIARLNSEVMTACAENENLRDRLVLAAERAERIDDKFEFDRGFNESTEVHHD